MTIINKTRACAVWFCFPLLCASLRAQSPLECFTNQANAFLEAQFGFGVTNIPVYSATNPTVAYNSSIHFLLQSAADLYEAAIPATNLPSVFRPLCAWQGSNLFITGYSWVTNNTLNQLEVHFKNVNDPTITTNDNVWGIPWVVGTKGQVPAFNEDCYSSGVTLSRQLYFTRATTNGYAITNRPPLYTNQIYILSVSNAFGLDAWNFYPETFTNPVLLFISNFVSITVTNNYNAGYVTNLHFVVNTNIFVDSWQGWPGEPSNSGFFIPIMTNIVSLPTSYWSPSTGQFIPWQTNSNILSNDLVQQGWPNYEWTLNITNSLLYALVDLRTRQPLDFVNLGPFGSSVDVMQVLEFSPSDNMWNTNSVSYGVPLGVFDQIEQGIAEDTTGEFFFSLMGMGNGYSSNVSVFECPYVPSGSIVQPASWHAANPIVHFTTNDLTDPNPFNRQVAYVTEPSQPLSLSNSYSVGTLGLIPPDYCPGEPTSGEIGFGNGNFQIDFNGVNDLPYLVWGSPYLLNWAPIGTAAQSSPGVFQYTDSCTTNNPRRFYQVQLP